MGNFSAGLWSDIWLFDEEFERHSNYGSMMMTTLEYDSFGCRLGGEWFSDLALAHDSPEFRVEIALSP